MGEGLFWLGEFRVTATMKPPVVSHLWCAGWIGPKCSMLPTGECTELQEPRVEVLCGLGKGMAGTQVAPSLVHIGIIPWRWRG